jgi:hypothetical protein
MPRASFVVGVIDPDIVVYNAIVFWKISVEILANCLFGMPGVNNRQHSPIISGVMSIDGQVPAKSFHRGCGTVVIGHWASRWLDAHVNPIGAGFGNDCIVYRLQHAV